MLRTNSIGTVKKLKKILKKGNQKNVFAHEDFPFEVVEDFNHLGVFSHWLILKHDIVGENNRLEL